MTLRKALPVALFLAALAGAWFVADVSPMHLRQTAFLSASSAEGTPKKVSKKAEGSNASSAKAPARDAFGIEEGRFATSSASFQEGETLADFLTSRGMAYETVLHMVEEARPVLDTRHIRPGQRFRFYRDEKGDVRRIVYEKSRRDYVVFAWNDSLGVRAGRRPVEHVRRTARGVVDGSLYASLGRADAPATLTRRLVEMYAWQIDFFRLRKGDRFAVVYEEQRVAGEPVGVGDVLAAQIQHRGEDFGAYRFTQGGRTEYFDAEGHSLRKSLLKAPLKYQRISSGYSDSRMHPILNRRRPHHGVDYAAPRGAPVHSVGDGRVLRAGRAGGAGNYVKIRHSSTYTTGYMHLARFADGIAPGAVVEQGQTIGYVGSTGLSTGPHLDYRFWKDGATVDPTEEEMPASRTVTPARRAAFDRRVARLRPLLTGPAGADALAQEEGGGRLPHGALAQPDVLLPLAWPRVPLEAKNAPSSQRG